MKKYNLRDPADYAEYERITRKFEDAVKASENVEFKNEAELLIWPERWLKDHGWDVFKEVSTPNGFCDMVATKTIDGKFYRWAIEGKMSCNCEVIFQADRNRPYFDFVSIITPASPNDIFKIFMRERGIGCLQVMKYSEKSYRDGKYIYPGDHWDDEDEAARYGCKPLEIDGEFKFNYALTVISAADCLTAYKGEHVELHELMKAETAGKNHGERLTPYKMSVMKIQEYIKANGPSTIDAIVKDIGDKLHWGNVRDGIRNAVNEWERDKFHTEYDYSGGGRGKLTISNKPAILKKDA